MKVKITTALHYGTFDAELEERKPDVEIDIENDLFDEDFGKLVSFFVVDSNDGTRLRITMRKRDITAVEEEA